MNRHNIIEVSSSTSQSVVSPGDQGISPTLASFIAQTVQAALAANRLRNATLSAVSSSASLLLVSSSSVPAAVTSLCSVGGSPLLWGSVSNFLAAGAGFGGLLQQGRPTLSNSVAMPFLFPPLQCHC